MPRTFSSGIGLEDIDSFTDVGKCRIGGMFTTNERKYCQKCSFPGRHFAARSAAKKAVMEALRRFGEYPELAKIEVLNNSDGQPYVNFKNNSLNKSFKCYLSLTHSDAQAVAFSMILKKRG